jgi:hypothetical protein
MKKTDYVQTNLNKGFVRTYDFGTTKLHYYTANDPIGDQVILVEGAKGIVSIEAPLLKESVQELNAFVASLKKPVVILLANHVAPKDYLPDAPLITTRKAHVALTSGSQIALYNSFRKAFGNAIQDEDRENFSFVKEGKNILEGVELCLLENHDGFDVEIPSVNSLYLHMLGHDVHSIVPGLEGAKAMIAGLEGAERKNYDLLLTSHYEAEDENDVATKIAYLRKTIEIAASSNDRASFTAAMKSAFPKYQGDNYLGISASIFFEK